MIEPKEDNHILYHPDKFLHFLKEVVKGKDKAELGETKGEFKVFGTHEENVSIINNECWLNATELLGWYEMLKDFDLSEVKTLIIGYTSGLHGPYKSSKISHSNDYYNVHFKLI